MHIKKNFCPLHVKELSHVLWDRERFSNPRLIGHNVYSSEIVITKSECLWTGGFIANRKELVIKGGVSNEISDKDLILHLYKDFGLSILEHINGPFAWILWDADLSELIAVRDRMGSVGLYYRVDGSTITISDSVEKLIKSTSLKNVNLFSVAAFLNSQAPLPGQTFFNDIFAVEPGEYISIRQGGFTRDHYWLLKPQPSLEMTSDLAFSNTLHELLINIISEYIPQDNSFGITLSGGLDSTSIAASIRSVSHNKNLVAFSWVSPELPEADESQRIELVVRKLGLTLVKIRGDHFWPFVSKGISTSRSSPFYNYYVELWDETYKQVQQNKINTLFTGAGGDHLFGGNVYSYPDLLLSGRWVDLIHEIQKHLPNSRSGLPKIIKSMIIKPIFYTYFTGAQKKIVLTPWLGKSLIPYYHEYSSQTKLKLPLRMLPGEQQRYRGINIPWMSMVLEDINVHGKKYGIEQRHPLFDHRLIEFALSIPTTQTFRSAVRKVILRNAMKTYLPEEVISFEGKVYPENIFYRGVVEREQDKVRKLFTNMRASELGLIDEKLLITEFESYANKKSKNTHFWRALTLEDWLRRYF